MELSEAKVDRLQRLVELVQKKENIPVFAESLGQHILVGFEQMLILDIDRARELAEILYYAVEEDLEYDEEQHELFMTLLEIREL